MENARGNDEPSELHNSVQRWFGTTNPSQSHESADRPPLVLEPAAHPSPPLIFRFPEHERELPPQVKAFRMLRSRFTPGGKARTLSSSAAANALRSIGHERRGQERGDQSMNEDDGPDRRVLDTQAALAPGEKATDEERRRHRRPGAECRFGSEEAENPAASTASVPASSAAAAAAVEVVRGTRTAEVRPSEGVHSQRVFPQLASFKSSCPSFCPGLYCNAGTSRRGEQPQVQERQSSSASQNDGRRATEEAGGGMGAEADRVGEKGGGWTDAQVALLMSVGDDQIEEQGENFAAGDVPMFQLPLKVSEVGCGNQ